eukprot:gnl/TRDRNA2_/TRDRNA2_154161_c2_seq2.p1 gnl/TRDRNA2_/TRDRNA2_154161_c2~~gnl/TRDRNA2_/TRDRNA2_154161_c2_seq2.p1  ORF type:complete len:308 (+),score=63.86 gnl/TRDRNA2_/TRDRNA2_154161_c2_seq2:132-1055(+)
MVVGVLKGSELSLDDLFGYSKLQELLLVIIAQLNEQDGKIQRIEDGQKNLEDACAACQQNLEDVCALIGHRLDEDDEALANCSKQTDGCRQEVTHCEENLKNYEEQLHTCEEHVHAVEEQMRLSEEQRHMCEEHVRAVEEQMRLMLEAKVAKAEVPTDAKAGPLANGDNSAEILRTIQLLMDRVSILEERSPRASPGCQASSIAEQPQAQVQASEAHLQTSGRSPTAELHPCLSYGRDDRVQQATARYLPHSESPQKRPGTSRSSSDITAAWLARSASAGVPQPVDQKSCDHAALNKSRIRDRPQPL